MATKLTTLTNTDRDFYRLVGPFLGRRDVHKQVGGPIYDDEGKTWIVATDGRHVAGFIGIRSGARIQGAVAESCYLADPDDTDLLGVLIRAAVASVSPTPVHATVRRDREKTYTAAGFVVASTTNGFIKVVHNGRS